MDKQNTFKSTAYYNVNYEYTSIQKDYKDGVKMHGVRRVLTFCLLTTILPSVLIIIPLYLRNIKYADVMYKVSDSDIIQIHQGQSSVFCERHSLKMNTTFNAFQMKGWPETSKDKRRHIQLKKSMTLPDDTLEYWGFYLLKGATVELKACSRYEGSKILVVRGERVLNTCDILNDNKHKIQTKVVNNRGHVVVTLESPDVNKTKNSTYGLKKGDKENNAEENFSDYTDELLILRKSLQNKINKHAMDINNSSVEGTDISINRLNLDKKQHKISRFKRDAAKTLHNPNTVLDTGVNHGGNAFNGTNHMEDSSVSSFENSLHQCYRDNTLINNVLPYAGQCKSTEYLVKTTTLKVTHQVSHDGYYYYIFYSDNDIVQNDIHAIFDIYKPTFQYANLSESNMCINNTECDFQVNFLSHESVIVEIPTKDGIKYEVDDSLILTSVCHPRMSVYIFFPVAVLLLILLFAFL